MALPAGRASLTLAINFFGIAMTQFKPNGNYVERALERPQKYFFQVASHAVPILYLWIRVMLKARRLIATSRNKIMRLTLKKKILKKLSLTAHPRYTFAPVYIPVWKKPKGYLRGLREKQRLRYHHSLTNRQLERYTTNIRKYPGPGGLLLLCELAMRLDSILFQVGFADSIRSARQLIRHGHIFVNGYQVSLPGYKCVKDDLICVAPTPTARRLVNRYLLATRRHSVGSSPLGLWEDSASSSTSTAGYGYADICVRDQKILIKRKIKPRELTFRVNHMLVMEYFS